MSFETLCHIDDIEDGHVKEFALGTSHAFFVVRQGSAFYGYINRCPHLSWPLNMSPNGFLDADKRYIQCANHMALFDIKSGECLAGPCVRQFLTPVNLHLANDYLWVEK